MNKWIIKIPLYLAFTAVLAVVIVSAWPPDGDRLSRQTVLSRIIKDRNGHLMRRTLSDQSGHAVWIRLDEGELIPRAFVTLEDRRFYSHLGIDPLALVRAGWSNL
ncbi:transglycosylase domain-containing protein, partial [candidate division KSB1 bacterium]|nr:transglycosylase domain-containing protein [candidate division KSB1 bacterium]